MDGDFLIGDWIVRPQRGCIEKGEDVVHLAPKAMATLCCLAKSHGKVASRQELFDAVWPHAEVTDDALTQRIVEIRKAFGDLGRIRTVVETVPKVGFRLIPPVAPLPPSPDSNDSRSGDHPTSKSAHSSTRLVATLAAFAVGIAGIWLISNGPGAVEPRDAVPSIVTDDPASQWQPTPLPPITGSVAVLPFHDIGTAEDELDLAEALRDELVTRLTRIATLKVIAAGSLEGHMASALEPSRIGKELAVDKVLTGTVQRIGEMVRIRTQLVDAATNEHLWGQSFDRQLTAANIFAMQTEIAEQVAKVLLASLSPDETARLGYAPTDNLEAYQAMLLGHARLKEGTRDAFDAAMYHYQRALELNPDFPDVYLAMARAYVLAAEEYGVSDLEAREKIEAFAEAALALDPQQGLAFNYLAVVRRENGQLSEALRLFQRALQLAPGNPRILHGMGLTLRLQGRPQEAIAYYERAVEISPMSPAINESFGSLLRDLGRFEDAERQYKVTLQLDPTNAVTHWGLGTLYWSIGRPDAARTSFENATRHAPASDVFRALATLMLLETGQDVLAREAIDTAMQHDEAGHENDNVLVAELYRIYHGLDVDGIPDGRRFMPRYWYGGIIDLPLRPLLDGQYAAAVDAYKARFPELADGAVSIDGSNYRAAIYLAFALDRIGDGARSEMLLDGVAAFLPTQQRLGLHGFWVADAQLMALRGERDAGMRLLTQAVDEGWRNLWRFYLLHDPILKTLSGSPGFDALVRRVREDNPVSAVAH